MKLTVGGKKIAIPLDAKISIEKSSPFMNDDTGSFSYPFAVPTLPNQQLLGWPGRLQRVGDIADKSFILEHNGVQIFRGETEFDTVTKDEIGLILKSGYTEFKQKMTDKVLGDIDYGSEWWPVSDDYYGTNNGDVPSIFAKFEEWNTANNVDNGIYVVAPFIIGSPSDDFGKRAVNRLISGGEYLPLGVDYNHAQWWIGEAAAYPDKLLFSLQFKVSFLMQKIFDSAGYTITENEFITSEFNKAVIFGNVFQLWYYQNTELGHCVTYPVLETLNYAALMPDIDVIDFMDAIKNMFCLMFVIDERKKEVSIRFKKEIFAANNTAALDMKELQGWEHRELPAKKGFALRYSSQDNDKDLEYNYAISETVDTLPTGLVEGNIYHLTPYDRDYIVVLNSDNVLEWQEIGRLKEAREGKGENVVELDVCVPAQVAFKFDGDGGLFDAPWLPKISHVPDSYQSAKILPTTDFLAVSLYHGIKNNAGSSYPLISFDRYWCNPTIVPTIDNEMSLKPAYLYDRIYSDVINWQTYRARGFTKYVQLTLSELLMLQWDKKYVINSIEIILDKINFELPHYGTVKIEGFTS